MDIHIGFFIFQIMSQETNRNQPQGSTQAAAATASGVGQQQLQSTVTTNAVHPTTISTQLEQEHLQKLQHTQQLNEQADHVSAVPC